MSYGQVMEGQIIQKFSHSCHSCSRYIENISDISTIDEWMDGLLAILHPFCRACLR